MNYSSMLEHPEFPKFRKLYDERNGGYVQSRGFNKDGRENPIVKPSVSDLSQMPSVVLSKFEDYLNGEYK